MSPLSSIAQLKTTLNIKHFSIIKLQLTTTAQPQSFLPSFPLLPRNPIWYFWQYIIKIPSGFIAAGHGIQKPSSRGGLLLVGWAVQGDASTQKQISICRLLLWAGLVGPRLYHSPTWSARFSAEQKNSLKYTPWLFMQDPPLANIKMCFHRHEHPSKSSAEDGGPKIVPPWTMQKKEQLAVPDTSEPSCAKQLPQSWSHPRLCHLWPAPGKLAKLWLRKGDAQCLGMAKTPELSTMQFCSSSIDCSCKDRFVKLN